MWLLSLIVLIPLAIVFFGSFKTQAEAVAFSLKLPESWHFENYKTVIEEAHILRAMINSLIITIASVAVCVLFSSMGAFVLAASTLQTFFYIIFPIAKSATVSVASLIFLGIWNDINIPLYYMSDSKLWTMPITIYNFFGQYYQSWNLVFANIVLIALPVFLIYVLSQRYLVAGLTVGAVKG